MKVLSFASYAKVLVLCKAVHTTKKNLIGTILLSVNPDYDMREDDAAMSALVNGRKNLSDAVTKFADKEAPIGVSEYFKREVLPHIDPNKQPNVVLALQDIVKNDNSIWDLTEIELVNKLSKGDFLAKKEFVFADLLAGLFLYVVKNTKNNNQEANVQEITDNYIKSFDEKRAEISFVHPTENRDPLLTTMPPAHLMRLAAEQSNKCPLCGKIIDIKKSTLIKLGENEEMLFCLECAVKVQESGAEKEKFLDEKRQLRRYCEASDLVAKHHLPEYIRELIEIIAKKDIESQMKINMNPKKVEDKVSDRLLKRKIIASITEGIYEFVDKTIAQLSEANKINVNNFRKSVRRMYEDAEDTMLPQSRIFNLLVEHLNDCSGRKSLEACEVVISYFVQSCEVFR